MNHDGHETRYRIRRLTQWVLEPVKVIRRPYIAELIMASGHMPASKGRTYDCTAPTGSCLHKPLACRAVPHMRQNRLDDLFQVNAPTDLLKLNQPPYLG
jgi:hypothetical protein